MKEIVRGGIVEEFINWFHSRGDFYAKLSVKFYMDGEPYFSSQGAEFSLRDYLRLRQEEEFAIYGNKKMEIGGEKLK